MASRRSISLRKHTPLALRSHAPGLCSVRQHVPGHGWRPVDVRPEPLPPPLSWAALSATPRWACDTLGVAILPRGLPDAVSPNYMPYVRWTAVGLLFGRVQAVLATQAALFAVGLGAGAIPMAAAVQWVLKDGLGHASAMAYAGAINTRFDTDAKRYRFHSTIALTAADAIAVAMPLAPQYFLLMASLSSAVGSIAHVAQTSARARIMASFALQGNLADCVRAGAVQAKLASLFGTGIGAGLSLAIGPDPYLTLAALPPLAAVSLYCTFVSSRIVILRGLNVQRAERALAPLLPAHVAEAAAEDGGAGTGGKVALVGPLTPEQARATPHRLLPPAHTAAAARPFALLCSAPWPL